jgi:hypothetical protein
MFRYQLDGVIEVARFEDKDSAQHLPGFGVGAIRDRYFAVLPAQSPGGFGGLKGLAGGEMSVVAQHVVVDEALVQHGVAFGFRHSFKLVRRDVSKADEFHDLSFFEFDSLQLQQLIVWEFENSTVWKDFICGWESIRRSWLVVRGSEKT